MNEFWQNIIRYPRFFISSLAGLILIIIRPILNLFKAKGSKPTIILLKLLLILSFSILCFVILNMIGLL
jgi:hypothetical protein